MNQQEDKLQGEILEDAKTKAERIIAKAKNDADAVIEKAKQDAHDKHQQRIQDAHDEADKQVKTILAGIQMEVLRRWLDQQEQCIDTVLLEALEQACNSTGKQREDAMTYLAKEALQAIGNEACTVMVGPADQDLKPEWIGQLAQDLFQDSHVGPFTLDVKADIKGGLILQTLDGRKTFDNTFSRRLERMKDDLRLVLVNGSQEN